MKIFSCMVRHSPTDRYGMLTTSKPFPNFFRVIFLSEVFPTTLESDQDD